MEALEQICGSSGPAGKDREGCPEEILPIGHLIYPAYGLDHQVFFTSSFWSFVRFPLGHFYFKMVVTGPAFGTLEEQRESGRFSDFRIWTYFRQAVKIVELAHELGSISKTRGIYGYIARYPRVLTVLYV